MLLQSGGRRPDAYIRWRLGGAKFARDCSAPNLGLALACNVLLGADNMRLTAARNSDVPAPRTQPFIDMRRRSAREEAIFCLAGSRWEPPCEFQRLVDRSLLPACRGLVTATAVCCGTYICAGQTEMVALGVLHLR